MVAQSAQTGTGSEEVHPSALLQCCQLHLSGSSHELTTLVASTTASSQLHPPLIQSRWFYTLSPHGSQRGVGSLPWELDGQEASQALLQTS